MSKAEDSTGLIDTYILAGCWDATEWIESNVFGALRDLAIDPDRDDGALLLLLEKPLRLDLLFEVQFGDDDLRTLLAYVWPDIEQPSNWGNQNLLSLFRRAGFVSDGQPQPTEPLTIYRGVCSSRYRSGLSWTTDRERAYFFARRFAFDGRGVVYTGIADPKHILGMFDDRQETEIVVDPSMVRRIRAIERGLIFSAADGIQQQGNSNGV